MNKVFVAAVVALTLLSSCVPAPTAQYESLERIGWDDFSPFARSLRHPRLLSKYPFLRTAPVYHLAMHLEPDLTNIVASAAVRWTNPGPTPRQSLDFVLLPNIVAGSLEISRVRVDGGEIRPDVTSDGMVLQIPLSPALTAGKAVTVSIDYSLSIPRSTTVGFGGLESADGIISLAYAYPMVPAGGRWPYGKPPSYGDLTANPASFYVAEISYPSSLVLAAPGASLHHAEGSGTARDLVALGPARDFYLELGADLTVTRRQVEGIELRTYTQPAAVEHAAAVLDTAAHALPIFESLFGSYPYRNLTFVSTKFDAYGLEFPGAIVLTSWLLGDPARVVHGARVSALLEATVAHEVAHQWFYALVGNDQLSEPWIDEAFAQYATLRYYRARYGDNGAAGFRRSLDSRRSIVDDAPIPIGGAVASYTPKQYSAVIYGRGPLFLEQLSKRLGAQRYDELMRRLTRIYRWKIVTGSDIRIAAEQSCECSLDALWNAWVNTPDRPPARP